LFIGRHAKKNRMKWEKKIRGGEAKSREKPNIEVERQKKPPPPKDKPGSFKWGKEYSKRGGKASLDKFWGHELGNKKKQIQRQKA